MLNRQPNPAVTLRSESEMERKPEVPASNRDEALFHFVKPSGVPRGPCMRSYLRSQAQVEGTQGFLPQPEKDLERPFSLC